MKKTKIYIVEDYRLIRATYKHFFASVENLEVLGDFETAEDCIDAMETQKADVILMDLGLPNMNGIQATQYIHDNFPDTKVIILTSHDKEEEVYASLASGANAYALKEIPLTELVKTIECVKKGGVWIDPKIAKMVLNIFPKPHDASDFENLYQKPDNDFGLSMREKEVLKLVVQGKSNLEIADDINISLNTAKAHLVRIFEKLNVSDRVQAAVKAVKCKLY
ncbi:MAG: response regulator transcription factor [Brachyspira sp.]|nr:response regulator transcription factor [Brachyspira sp.]